MAYFTESSSDEDFEGASSELITEENIAEATWDAERSSEDEEESLNDTDSINEPVKIASRAYQLEMLDASLRENVIVAMDTGSGKTQVWSASTWDTALDNIKIVITTPQVLLDALLHGFVCISSLALLVFDEAHHCNSNHAYSRIMREFYWASKAKKDPVPHILGLTASPVVRSEISALEKLESTLDSVCRSPTRHREELLAHSQRPSLVNITFKSRQQLPLTEYSESMKKIIAARSRLNIMEDPWVVSLIHDKTDRARRQLEKALKQKSTYVQNSMKSFCRRSVEVAINLGIWAADWYIFETIKRFLAGIIRQGATSESWRDAEVVYLARVFQDVDVKPPSIYNQSDSSNKVRRLIELLLSNDDDARGIVFVQERYTTVVLAHILTLHPEVSKKFRIGIMVGTSFVPGVKRDFLDLPEESAGSLSLEAFRTGKKNLLVATSVLEEGIDVPACNLIACVDKPANLKAFIQRRGRARMRQSKLYILVDEEDTSASKNWEQLEADMKRHYEDDMRKLQEIEALEDIEKLDYPELRVESTGARLTIRDAKSHLQHFCSTLTSRKYVNYQPDYIIEELHDSARPGAPILLKATVLLPISVPQHLRKATSSRAWLSEKNACMDAAFQAYAALFRAEPPLLTDHLLPLRDSLVRDIGIRPGMTSARALANPWVDIARAWTNDQAQLHRRNLKVLDQSGSLLCDFALVLPRAIPALPPMVIWSDHETHLTLQLDPDAEMADVELNDPPSGLPGADGHTHILLALAFGHRTMLIKDDCVLRLICPAVSLSLDQLGSVAFNPDIVARDGEVYLVRDEREYQARHPYFFDSFLPSKPPQESCQKIYKGFEEAPDGVPYLTVKKWPKKSGLFQRPVAPTHVPSTKPYAFVIPAETATIDSIPAKYAQAGLLVPALIYYIEVYLLANELCHTILAPLKLSDTSMVVDTICASSARTPTNYERVEFLGDSILKTCITVNLAATNLRLPEGLLSLLKDRLISNSRLYRSATDSGLDQFIVTKELTLHGGWHPPYISDLLSAQSEQEQDERIMSTKTLADVVEAIIGASYLDGGLPKALDCIHLFVPESQPKNFSEVRNILFEAAAPKDMALPADLIPLESLLNYTFSEKALLVEAMTHPSYNVGDTVACFDRLEFIGDAILDFIVVEELYAVRPPLPNWQLHLLRTALVNADILGFLVMEFSYKQLGFDIVRVDSDSDSSFGFGRDLPATNPPELTETVVDIPLWSFMRQASPELTIEREATKARHAALREPLLAALKAGKHYPWALLARLHAQKFYSDLFEALVGAIWVDSGPDFDVCRAFVERAGILPYVRRLLRDGVHALHPKEELGRLAGQEKVEYIVADVEREDGEGREWTCEVMIGSRSIVAVGDCLFREEAKVRAATQACQMLKDGCESVVTKPELGDHA
ncbi:Dicer-like protein 2 [Gnomoniopsis sp. IMI 355080]|nr:Dicer-like protein 2 [Gnomoniopsis sp. IMI 355080]